MVIDRATELLLLSLYLCLYPELYVEGQEESHPEQTDHHQIHPQKLHLQWEQLALASL